MTTPDNQIRELKHRVVGQTKQALEQARDRAGSSLGESKKQLADQLGGLASAFRRTTEQLRDEDRTTVAGLTEAVAWRADQAANYLRQANVRAARQDLERLARRRPALVLGGALALGLVTARFLKSSKRLPHVPRLSPGDPHAGA
jgi:hypothetical protein